jgi:hypothetical protein
LAQLLPVVLVLVAVVPVVPVLLVVHTQLEPLGQTTPPVLCDS